MASHEEILKTLFVLVGAYPAFNLTEHTIDIYWRTLSDVPTRELELAALDHIKHSKFFPTVAELRGTYDEKQSRLLRQQEERRWKENLERYRAEALTAGDAKKRLQALNDAARKPGKNSLVPFRRNLREILAESPTTGYEVGSHMTEEEWENRKLQARASAKAVDGAPRSVRGMEVKSPNSAGGRGA